MATNPYVNKVYRSTGEKIMDISDSTITPYTINIGEIAYDATGKRIVGETPPKILGLEADFTNGTFTRLEDAVGLSAGSDFDNFAMYKRKRCNMDTDGNIIAYYGESGYSDSGGTTDLIMVEQPKFWYKVEPITLDGVQIRKARYYVADKPAPGFKLHPAFIGLDGTEKDYVYESAYEASTNYSSSPRTLRSASGYLPTAAQSRSTIRSYAQDFGQHWRQAIIQVESAVQLLMVIEYGTFKLKSVLGQGIVNNSQVTDPTKTGYFNGSYSNKNGSYGSTANYTTAVVYRGKENPWGNTAKHVDGININSAKIYIANTYNFADDTSDNYTEVQFDIPKENKPIKFFGYDENFDWLFAPAYAEDTNYIDGQCRMLNSGWAGLFIGGYYRSSSYAGAFMWDYQGSTAGARLTYIL